ncbi:MAG TPA: 16S rRNA (uracil(1498)-N(3))-methyltransferase [Lentisphaerae bacterium]|nr:16S rRNA (uracil(1498)-N(3))-methyltransferase [Lentisphaerota bacterium]
MRGRTCCPPAGDMLLCCTCGPESSTDVLREGRLSNMMSRERPRIRCFVPPEGWCESGILRPPDSEAHHLRHVLRVKEGERVEVFDGEGKAALCLVRSSGRRGLTLEITTVRTVRPPRVKPVSACAIIRPQRMDWWIQKATELGAARLVPLICDRNVVHLAPSAVAPRVARWRKIAVEACRQSGRCILPEVVRPIPLIGFLDAVRDTGATLLFCSAQEGALPLRLILEGDGVASVPAVVMLTGPEGDFSEREIAAARAAGAHLVSLGRSILRTETAAVFACAAVRYRMGADVEESSG